MLQYEHRDRPLAGHVDLADNLQLKPAAEIDRSSSCRTPTKHAPEAPRMLSADIDFHTSLDITFFAANMSLLIYLFNHRAGHLCLAPLRNQENGPF